VRRRYRRRRCSRSVRNAVTVSAIPAMTRTIISNPPAIDATKDRADPDSACAALGAVRALAVAAAASA